MINKRVDRPNGFAKRLKPTEPEQKLCTLIKAPELQRKRRQRKR